MKQSNSRELKSFIFSLIQTLLRNTIRICHSKRSYLPILLVIILMCSGVVWEFFIPSFLATTDPARYQCYALAFWYGTAAAHRLPDNQCTFLNPAHLIPPFHLLPFEYPSLSVMLFSLPLLVPLVHYQISFALLMAGVMLGIYGLLQRYGPAGSALAFGFSLLIGVPALVFVRFDLLPALCTLLCIVAAERQRWTIAYVALAFGVLLKLYPMLLLPVVWLAEQQARGCFFRATEDFAGQHDQKRYWYILQCIRCCRWQNCLLFLMLLLGTTALFAMLDFHGAVVSQFSYFLKRPIQVESTGSTVLWIARRMGMGWQEIVYSYGSINIVGDKLAPGISLVGMSCLAVGVASILWLQWRKKLDLVQASIALILVLLATGKIFSPQYLIWLMPLLAYAGAYNRLWIFHWGMILSFTTIIYIFFYSQLPSSINAHIITLPVGFLPVVNVRNVWLVGLTLAYLFNWRNIRQRKHLPLKSKEAEGLAIAQNYPSLEARIV